MLVFLAHQLSALAEAGFHAVAPDMRRYGQTDAPQETDRYTLLHSVGDMVGLLDALGLENAVIAGHDWGAPVAWLAAQLRPDRFRGVIALSVPFLARGPVRPTTVMPQTDRALWYQLYFQEPGVAEAELDHNVRTVFRHAGFRHGAAAGWIVCPRFPALAVACLADRSRCRFVYERIHPHRLSWRPQLVS
jgi:pimeloyl-ACP methyl ester carboxylesterase